VHQIHMISLAPGLDMNYLGIAAWLPAFKNSRLFLITNHTYPRPMHRQLILRSAAVIVGYSFAPSLSSSKVTWYRQVETLQRGWGSGESTAIQNQYKSLLASCLLYYIYQENRTNPRYRGYL